MQTTKQSLSFQAQKNLTGSKLSYDNRTPIKYVEVIFVILNNNELNAEILRKAFEGADLGVVCVRGKGFIESDDDNLCYLFGFDDGFECFVYEVLYFNEDNMDVSHCLLYTSDAADD